MRKAFALLALLVALPGSAAAGTILGTARHDRVRGTAGDDLIDVVGGGIDDVRCGAGIDSVMVDPSDHVARDCEVVARRIAVDSSGGPGRHQTIVEPAVAAAGRTVVAVFQMGRRAAGADAVGFTVSFDGGATWRRPANLAPQTTGSGIASDPAIAYDARHARWIATALTAVGDEEAIVASTSAGDGNFSPLIDIVRKPCSCTTDVPLDKEWIACDNSAPSPFYGRCYVALTVDPDTPAAQLGLWMSDDAGQTWTAGPLLPQGYFAQIAVRPDGSLVLVYSDLARGAFVAATSRDGGATFDAPVTIAAPSKGFPSTLRAPTLPSVAVTPSGELLAVWSDCLALCTQYDIVLSRSPDGATWSVPQVIPLGVGEHVLPVLAADSIAGSLALADYVTPVGRCCALVAQVASSRDDGATWTWRRASVRPLPSLWLPRASGGVFLGDYVGATFVGHRPLAVIPIADPPRRGALQEALFAVRY